MTRTFKALMAATALTFVAAPAFAQSSPTPPMQVHAMAAQPALNLSAYGEVRVAPDMATITFGVQTEAPTAQAAMADNARRMQELNQAWEVLGDPTVRAAYDRLRNRPAAG